MLLADANGELTTELESELERQADRLARQIDEGRTRVECLRELLDVAEQQLMADEVMLAQLEGTLGRRGQLSLEASQTKLRGQRLREIALEILVRRADPGEGVHYRQWYEWVREAGYRVSGRDPLATFLTHVSRSSSVERVGGGRSGRYRIRQQAGHAT